MHAQFKRTAAGVACLLLAASYANAATYEVGPGKAYLSINAVPWESLAPGDLVLIHWRSTPYKEKWVICRQGTAQAPIVIRGVPGPAGQLPVIDGNGATTRTNLNYWAESRAVIKIGGANVPADTTPRFIVVDGLDIRSARPPYTFTADDGSIQSYLPNASTIYVEKGENITIRRFGPLRAGSLGNNLKDRSAGLVVRYNWIESGNRQLDLVDAEDAVLIRASPEYDETLVHGNVLIIVRDSQNVPDSAQKAFVLKVKIAPLKIATASLSSARLGRAHKKPIKVSGGVPPYTWSILNGGLPPGVTLDAASGFVSGVPTALGSWNLTVEVRDARVPSVAVTRAHSVTVAP